MTQQQEIVLLKKAAEILRVHRDLHTKWCDKFPRYEDGTCRCGGSDKLLAQIDELNLEGYE